MDSQGSQSRRSVRLKLAKSLGSLSDSVNKKKRVQVVDQYEIPSNASCEYYEEVIEESEEEDDS